jgi:predicted transcriptional regulator
MTSSKLMAEVLKKLPDEPAPMQDLCMILKRTEANVRRILADMGELGLVEKVEISIPGRKVRYGWKKAVHGGDSQKRG